MTDLADIPRRRVLAGLMAGFGLVCGGGLGFGVGRLVKVGLLNLDRLGWSGVLGLSLGGILILTGVVLAIAGARPRLASRMAIEGAAPSGPGQRAFLHRQALVTLLSGLMLATPIVAQALYSQPGPVMRMALFGAIVVAFAVQTTANLAVWRTADEFLRRLISESSVACFWGLQGALFLWASAEKLGLAPALSTWDCTVTLMAAYLGASSYIAIRNGVSSPSS